MKKNTFLLIPLVGSLLWLGSCYKDSDSSTEAGYAGEAGQGGSLARFTIAKNHLYVLNQDKLKAFDIKEPEKPVISTEVISVWGAETLFPFGNYLLMGTQSGMNIYDLSHPSRPEYVSYYQHIVSCDPVVAEGDYAYVTLNTANTWCGINHNVLQIVNIGNILEPYLYSSFDMSSPKGLDVRNDTLYLCDAGLKIFDVSDKSKLKLLHHFKNMAANDVICFNRHIMLIADDAFFQYSLENDSIYLISSILKGE